MDSDGHSDILVCSDHSSSWFHKRKFDWPSLFQFPVSRKNLEDVCDWAGVAESSRWKEC